MPRLIVAVGNTMVFAQTWHATSLHLSGNDVSPSDVARHVPTQATIISRISF
ncbi:MAG: hypothetical protein HDS16_05425 [Bacteroides sp.]|nr:hypothetical protein [Bacteroides sp.]